MTYQINEKEVNREDIVSVVGEEETRWYEKLSKNLFEIGCYMYTSKINDELCISFIA